MNNINEFEDYDQNIKEDVRLEIVIKMIKNNRPFQHIIEDTGYPEKDLLKLKEIIELIKKACTK